MFVTEHARSRLVARLGAEHGLAIVHALEKLHGERESLAIEVARLPGVVYAEDGSNGDSLVVIVRESTVETVMLRRSWNQLFSPQSLGVDRCVKLR